MGKGTKEGFGDATNALLFFNLGAGYINVSLCEDSFFCIFVNCVIIFHTCIFI